MTFQEGNRPAIPPPRIVGRASEDYARELQEFLERIFFFSSSTITVENELVETTTNLEAALDAAEEHIDNVEGFVNVGLPHPPRIPQMQAGTGVTLTYNALGPMVAVSFESDQNILANQIFGG